MLHIHVVLWSPPRTECLENIARYPPAWTGGAQEHFKALESPAVTRLAYSIQAFPEPIIHTACLCLPPRRRPGRSRGAHSGHAAGASRPGLRSTCSPGRAVLGTRLGSGAHPELLAWVPGLLSPRPGALVSAAQGASAQLVGEPARV